MAIRKVPLVKGECYHIYNRGNSKQLIFIDDEDYARFIKLLYLCNSKKRVNFRDDIVDKHIDAFDYEKGEPIISIGAWVLMPNHFHLYITEVSPKQGFGDFKEEEKSAITEFMSKLCTSYSKYFNKKYNRTGKLFEDKFKTIHVDNDIHAKYLFSYIHLNPIKLIDLKWKEDGIQDKNKALEFLDDYKFSSYHDFCGITRSENRIICVKDFPEYFSNIGDFKKEIFEWISFPQSSPKQGFGDFRGA